MNVYLTGSMGCGKSAVGRELARRLSRPFFDCDAAIERLAKKSIARIFQEDGEARFRNLERRALALLAAKKDVVVSLGGGALLDARNREAVSRGLSVRLTCAEPVLWRRLKPEIAARPLLAGGRAAFQALLKRRRRAYGRPDITVSTTRRGVRQAAALIARRLSA